jgi:hypothetical protein
MATAPSTPGGEHDQVQVRLSFVRLLIGPGVLLLSSALVIGSLFLPWYHFDARYLVGDPYSSDSQPFVPVQSFYAGDLIWLALAAIPIMATLVCLLIDATPFLRQQWLILSSAVCFGILTLVAGGVGIMLLIFYRGFLGLAGTIPHIMDSGYVMSFVGYILLAPGGIFLIIGQTHVRNMVRLGQLRAP